MLYRSLSKECNKVCYQSNTNSNKCSIDLYQKNAIKSVIRVILIVISAL